MIHPRAFFDVYDTLETHSRNCINCPQKAFINPLKQSGLFLDILGLQISTIYY